MNKNVLFHEKVISKRGDDILASNIRLATQYEINEALKLYQEGKCSHTIVYDEAGWFFDIRFCATCEKCLGFI